MPKVYGSSKRMHTPYISSDDSALSRVCSVSQPTSRRAAAATGHARRDQTSLDTFVLRPNTAANVIKSKPGPSKSKALVRSIPPRYAQLHFDSKPMLRSCAACQMSYVAGGTEDEAVHIRHHRGVVLGTPWDGGKGILNNSCDVAKVEVDRTFKRSTVPQGRLYCFNGQDGSAKMLEILSMVDTVLSAPPLPASILKLCKVFFFVTSVGTHPVRDRIAGVCVSQKIRWAMKVIEKKENEHEISEAVECDPLPLPASLGIHRIFTLPSLRRRGIAEEMLTAACDLTIYGCQVKPGDGGVAFSQPTRSGKVVMDSWGKGAIKVFVDDESQNVA